MAEQNSQAALPHQPAIPPGETSFRAGPPAPKLASLCKSIKRRLQAYRWRAKMQGFGKGSYIDGPRWLVNPAAINIGEQVRIWHHARLEAICSTPGITRLEIGDRSIIQPYAHIGAAHRVTIGKHVMIASNVFITDHDHDISDPMNPATINSGLDTAPVHIGDYTWLGEKVMVLKGVTIGERSVIGAGALVTRDIPPMSIAVGSPARVIRRFDPEAGQWLKVGPGHE